MTRYPNEIKTMARIVPIQTDSMLKDHTREYILAPSFFPTEVDATYLNSGQTAQLVNFDGASISGSLEEVARAVIVGKFNLTPMKSHLFIWASERYGGIRIVDQIEQRSIGDEVGSFSGRHIYLSTDCEELTPSLGPDSDPIYTMKELYKLNPLSFWERRKFERLLGEQRK